MPSGNPPDALPTPGGSGAQNGAVALVHGASTKLGAAAVPLFAAVKPVVKTPLLLTVFVRLNTSKLRARFIFSRMAKFLVRRVSKRVIGSFIRGLLGSHG